MKLTQCFEIQFELLFILFSNQTVTFTRISIVHITFILDDRFYAFDARVGTSIKNLAVNGRVVFNTVVSNHG